MGESGSDTEPGLSLHIVRMLTLVLGHYPSDM